jgi:glutamate-ammonia-ligase adenylyltransferase
MVDIEFIVQYLILLWAAEYPALLRWSDNVRQIESLAKEKRLSRKDAATLVQNYRQFRRRAYHLFLENRSARVADQEFVEERGQVVEIWNRLMR